MTTWVSGQPLNVVLVGVGGQGTILASDLLAEAGLRLGYDVKQAEIHGMSQRGGSVISNLRWGSRVFSPIVARGCADVLIGFEKLETLRFSDYLRHDGLALVNDYAIVPVTVSSGAATYPDDNLLREGIARMTPNQHWIRAVEIAEQAGNLRTTNVVMLGALARILGLPKVAFQESIKVRVPLKYQDVNLLAFDKGFEAAGA